MFGLLISHSALSACWVELEALDETRSQGKNISLRHQYCFREVRNLECGKDVCCVTAKLFPGHFLVTLARIP